VGSLEDGVDGARVDRENCDIGCGGVLGRGEAAVEFGGVQDIRQFAMA